MVARSQPQQALDDYAATKEDQQVGSAPYDTMTSRPVPSTSCYQATTARPQRSEQGTGLPRDEQPDPCAPHASAWSSLLATQASHAGRASPVRPPQLPINPTLVTQLTYRLLALRRRRAEAKHGLVDGGGMKDGGEGASGGELGPRRGAASTRGRVREMGRPGACDSRARRVHGPRLPGSEGHGARGMDSAMPA